MCIAIVYNPDYDVMDFDVTSQKLKYLEKEKSF